MRLNLTFPGFGGGSPRQPAGQVINANPAPDPRSEAEKVFKKARTPNQANRALYDRYVGGGTSRTQQRTLASSQTTPASTPGDTTQPPPPTSTVAASPDNPLSSTTALGQWNRGKSALGTVARALRSLTGA